MKKKTSSSSVPNKKPKDPAGKKVKPKVNKANAALVKPKVEVISIKQEPIVPKKENPIRVKEEFPSIMDVRSL